MFGIVIMVHLGNFIWPHSRVYENFFTTRKERQGMDSPCCVQLRSCGPHRTIKCLHLVLLIHDLEPGDGQSVLCATKKLWSTPHNKVPVLTTYDSCSGTIQVTHNQIYSSRS